MQTKNRESLGEFSNTSYVRFGAERVNGEAHVQTDRLLCQFQRVKSNTFIEITSSLLLFTAQAGQAQQAEQADEGSERNELVRICSLVI